MGYLVILRADRVVSKEDLAEFISTVPEHKSCPAYVSEKDPYCIYVSGSWSISGDKMRPFSHRCIRWFKKVKNIRLSADAHVGDRV